MPLERHNNADVVNELEGHWHAVLMAVMRKYNLKEVVLEPKDMEFMVPPYNQTEGKQPTFAAMGLRNVQQQGGFILAVVYGRDEAIDRMAAFQREHGFKQGDQR